MGERERDLERFLTFVDAIVAIAVTVVCLVIWLGVPESEPVRGRRLDTWWAEQQDARP